MIVPMLITPSGRIFAINTLVAIYDKKDVLLDEDGDPEFFDDDDAITLEYPSRVYKRFFGKDAEVVRNETIFAFNLYRENVALIIEARKQAAQIVKPAGGIL